MKQIVESHATGAEIGAIVAKIEPVINGHPQGHILIALLSMCIIFLKPTIDADGMQEAIREVSRFMCLYLNDDSEDEYMDAPPELLVENDPKKMN